MERFLQATNLTPPTYSTTQRTGIRTHGRPKVYWLKPALPKAQWLNSLSWLHKKRGNMVRRQLVILSYLSCCTPVVVSSRQLHRGQELPQVREPRLGLHVRFELKWGGTKLCSQRIWLGLASWAWRAEEVTGVPTLKLGSAQMQRLRSWSAVSNGSRRHRYISLLLQHHCSASALACWEPRSEVATPQRTQRRKARSSVRAARIPRQHHRSAPHRSTRRRGI
jgi:hypothetical protein